ncbi:MAG: hypothetical protein NPIRA02_29480 [Nitrospirales bacterium]|nr:MAG: hypothetical protein NPIRA02_29480 [Nitrospirales bacterium]
MGSLATPETVPVFFKSNPFDTHPPAFEIDIGVSMAECLSEFGEYAESLIVHVDGRPQPAACWHDILIETGHHYIVYVPPKNRGLARAAAITLTAINPASSVAFAYTFATTGDFDASLQAGVNTGYGPLGLAFGNTLTPKPKPLSNESDPLVYAITGFRNQPNPFGVIPKVYGKVRVFPFFPGKHPTQYTELSGDDQYLRAWFVVCKGPVRLSDVRLGDTSISSYHDVEIEILEGKSSDPPMTLYTRDIEEQSPNVALPLGGPRVIRTTGIDCEQISVDWSFLNGLQNFRNNGKKDDRRVDIQIEYRAVGAGTWIDRGTFMVVGRTGSILRRNHTWSVAKGQYEVAVRKVFDGGPEEGTSDATWTALRTIRNEVIYTEPECAMIALKIRANDQLNGPIDNLNVLVESELSTFNGSSWTSPQLTDNPAWAVADIFRGNGRVDPIQDSRLDGPSFLDWANNNDADGFAFNFIFDQDTGWVDAINIACAAGRASWDDVDGKYRIVQDVQQSIIRQHFTQRTVANVESTGAFPNTPNGYRVGFLNEESEYQEDERLVFADGFNESNATSYNFLQLQGVTNKDQIWKLVRRDWAALQLRFEEWAFDADYEHLACTRGDLVVWSHESILIGKGAARVVSVNGSSGVTVDRDFDITIAPHSVQIRRQDNTHVSVGLSNGPGTTRTLNFQSSVSGIQVGDLLSFGVSGQVVQRSLVKSIEHRDTEEGNAARVTLVPEASSVYTAGQGPIDPHNPIISIPNPPGLVTPPIPTIGNISSNQYVSNLDSGGTFQLAMIIELLLPSRFSYGEYLFEVQTKIASTDNPWASHPLTSATAQEVKIFDVEVGQTYAVRARSISRANPSRVSRYSTEKTHTVEGDTIPPEAPSDVVVSQTGPGFAILRWTKNDATDYRYTEVWRGTVNDRTHASTMLAYEKNDIVLVDDELADNTTYYYWLRDVDFALNPSPFHVGDTSGMSATTTSIATDRTPPNTPTGLTLTSSVSYTVDGVVTSELVADWDDNIEPDVVAYELERRIKNTATIHGAVAYDDSRYVFSATPNTEYEVRVRARDSSGNVSAFTTWVEETTPLHPQAPSQVVGVVAFAAIYDIAVKWDINPEPFVRRYNVQSADDASFSVNVEMVFTSANNISYKEESGTTKYFRVKAVTSTGVESNLWSQTVMATTVGIDFEALNNIEVKNEQLSNDLRGLIGTPQESFVLNGSGEEGDVGQNPTGWTFGGGTPFVVADDQKRIGARSIKVVHASAGQSFLNQDIVLKYGEVYTLEGWIRTNGLSGSAPNGVKLKVSPQTAFAFDFAFGDHSGDFDNTFPEPEIGVHSPGTGGQWFFVKRQFIPLAPGGSNDGDPADCRFTIVMGSDGNVSGTAWFDGIRVYRDVVVTTDVIAPGSVVTKHVGAEVIVASHLVKTEALLTEAAQMSTAFINNGHLKLAIIEEANITNLNVTTIKIAPNAVSVQGESRAAGPINMSTSFVFLDMIQFTYSAQGIGYATVFARINVNQFGGFHATLVTVELRSGTVVLDSHSKEYGFSFPDTMVLQGTDTPVPGNNLYTIRAKYQPGPSNPSGSPQQCSAQNMYIHVKESLK